ncbi:MAG: hypothetical protein ACP5OK_02035 [Thermoprotei archaeon]
MDIKSLIGKIAMSGIKAAIYMIIITLIFSIPFTHSFLQSVNVEPQSFMIYLIIIAISSAFTGILEDSVIGKIISIGIDLVFIAYIIVIASGGIYTTEYQGFMIKARYPVLLFVIILPLLTSIIESVWKIIHKSSTKPIRTIE